MARLSGRSAIATALFADPEAARYVQEVADRQAKVALDDMVEDPCREDFIGALSVLAHSRTVSGRSGPLRIMAGAILQATARGQARRPR